MGGGYSLNDGDQLIELIPQTPTMYLLSVADADGTGRVIYGCVTYYNTDGWLFEPEDNTVLTTRLMDWLSMRMRFLEDPMEVEEELEEVV